MTAIADLHVRQIWTGRLAELRSRHHRQIGSRKLADLAELASSTARKTPGFRPFSVKPAFNSVTTPLAHSFLAELKSSIGQVRHKWLVSCRVRARVTQRTNREHAGAGDGEAMTSPQRHRLPKRRIAETHELALGGMMLTATIGFGQTGRPAEMFLFGAKDGSGLAAILDDASAVISIALQHLIPARALAKRISRAPDGIGCIAAAASAIGVALDLIAQYEHERSGQ